MIKSRYASELTEQHIWKDFIGHFKSNVTEASYASDISEIMDYFEKDFPEIRKNHVQEYFDMMQNKISQKVIKPQTVAKKFRELHSFAEYICDNREKYKIDDKYQDEFYPYLKVLEKQKQFAKSVPVDNIDRLLRAAEDDIQAYMIIVMLYRVGLTSTEIIQLKTEDFAMYENGMYAVVEGRKDLCYIPEDAAEILKKFIECRKDMPFLFYNSRGNQLNLMYISRLMKKLSKSAGIPGCSAESIRNSCGFTLYAYGAMPEQVANQLGVTKMQIHRYKNEAYKDQIQQAANKLVKVKVIPPNTYE
ncbi:MAG: tyrosine-type recombinase/integrase [Lachnospiraceae bacterium]